MKKSANSVETQSPNKLRKYFSKIDIDKSVNFFFLAKESYPQAMSKFEKYPFIYVANEYEPNEVDKARCLLLNEHTFVHKHPFTGEYEPDLLNALYWCSYCAQSIMFDRFTDPLPKAVVLPRRNS